MHKKVKVLRIIARLNIGGPAIHTILLTEGLNSDRFDSLLVAGSLETGEGDMMYLAQQKGVRPLMISELGRKISLRNDLVAFWKLFQLLRKEKPDIIHTHTAKAGTLGRLAGILYNLVYSLQCLAVYSKSKCKLVHTFHGHVLHSYFGRLKTRIFIWIERILAIFTDRIIAVSDKVREELLSLGIGTAPKIVTIPLGLELDRLLEISPLPVRQAGNSGATVRVGVVGRLVPVKNHRMFLKAANRLLSSIQHPASSIQFIIVGDGELKSELENYVEQSGLKNSVIFTGWKKDLEKVYNGLDVVALTSLNEGTPVSIIEAMAAGKPVIATDVGGVSDLVASCRLPVTSLPWQKPEAEGNYRICERGILVRSGDDEGFAQGLSLLLNDGQLREKMGRSGREFVRDRFSKERLINDIENLYEELCSCPIYGAT
jgi:glycosyltransferase involved in cell wall biosynthesis